ncbi:MAG: hypothetical protein VR73_05780 [Gammaproteobacteria bacterium BRH_c0]|nr:MAG: hypothetical protein VR73_05780 [Gammaproteobacteria bacterium BRH_c0]
MNLHIAKLSQLTGAAGVDPRESELAKRVGILFEIPMLMAALWILMNWWGQSHTTGAAIQSNRYDLILWGLFVLESSILTLLANNKWRYIKGNWLNLVIIILGLPMLIGVQSYFGFLRLLRLLIIFSLIVHVGSRIRNLLSRNQLGTTLLASAIVIFMAGIMMSALDPGITSPMDGVWWAWVTVTTVGYGDVVPVTDVGKAFASVVILFGMGLFAMITASLAAFFISRQEEEMIVDERENYRLLSDLDRRLDQLEQKIDLLLQQHEGTGLQK